VRALRRLESLHKLVNVLRPSSIRGKIIGFALLATLLPSITMGWLSYRNNLNVLEEKLSKELTSITSQTSRELDLWVKERHYEIRVFASSYEVSENLERISESGSSAAGSRLALGRLAAYVKSVEQRFTDYRELAVLDLTGAVVATSAEPGTSVKLPADWMAIVRSEGMIVGDPYWDSTRSEMAMIIAEPVRGARESLLGLLAAKLNLIGVEALLERGAQGTTSRLQVINRKGVILCSAPPESGAPAAPLRLQAEETKSLFSDHSTPIEFVNARGESVVGILHKARGLNWGVLAEKNRELEFAEIARVRDVTIVLAASMLLGIGAAAYLLGLSLVRPLNSLIRAAGAVAGGDLDVDLPVSGGGEVGYLTVVFNRMVARLRTAREEIEATNKALVDKNEELHKLSITDGLTGLHNRSHMSGTIVSELKRAERNGYPVSILMMDIDFFKNFNDEKGHQAGDEVLRGVARVLKETLRDADYAARYGGEEFLILLPHTGSEEAIRTAERIRARVEQALRYLDPDGDPITMSVGVASSVDYGHESVTLIRRADIALYEAKRTGRNRVVAAWTADMEPSGNPTVAGS